MTIDTKLGKLPVYYGMVAMAKFADMAGITRDDALNKGLTGISTFQVFVFVYVGLLEGARKENEVCKVKSPEQVGDMIEEEPEIVTQVMDIYVKSISRPGDKGGKKKE